MSVAFSAAPALPDWLEAAFPERRRLARVDGEQIHFVDHGHGPVVLLVHGNPTWSFLWRKVIRALPDHRCVAPDLLGLGLSTKLRRPSEHTMERHLDILRRWVDALELDDVVVAGQDWGGPIGAGLAAHLAAQGRLRGLVFGNTAVVPPRRPLKTKPFHRFSQLPVISTAVFYGLNVPTRWLHRAQGDPGSIDAVARRAYLWPLRRRRDRAAPLGLARMVPSHEGHPSTSVIDRYGAFVESWEGPAALVWGERDPILGRGLKRHRRALPQARVWVTDAGHFSQEEVPDAWAEAIRSTRMPSDTEPG